jgi:NAD(P)H-flavin reductase
LIDAEPALSDSPWLSQTVRIEDISGEIPGVATYRLRFRDSQAHSRYRFRPGQFNMLYLPGLGEIAISLSGGPESSKTLDHTVRVAGNVTHRLARMKTGESLGLRGPYGTSWPIEECAGADFLIVGGGIGLAPLRPVITALLQDTLVSENKTLLFGTRTPDGLLYSRDYDQWSADGLNMQITVDRASLDWSGNIGAVPLLVDRLRPWSPNNSVLFVCGPEVMMRYTVRSALARGLPKQRIWISLERNMQCAVGLCGHCQLGPAFICKDGPVFRYDQIEPFLNVEML